MIVVTEITSPGGKLQLEFTHDGNTYNVKKGENVRCIRRADNVTVIIPDVVRFNAAFVDWDVSGLSTVPANAVELTQILTDFFRKPAVLDENLDAGGFQINNLGNAVANTDAINKGQVDTAIATAITGAAFLQGQLDCSTNPNYPAAFTSWFWFVSVPGKIGGAGGKVVQYGDKIQCVQNTFGGSEAVAGGDFFILQANMVQATEVIEGYSREATQAEVTAGVLSGAVFVNPLKLFTAATQWIADAINTAFGTTYKASQSEVDTGTNNTKFVTPLTFTTRVTTLISNAIAAIPSATTVLRGLIQLATNAEAIAGTDTGKAIVPSSLLATLAAEKSIRSVDIAAQSTTSTTYVDITGGSISIPNLAGNLTAVSSGTLHFADTNSTRNVYVAIADENNVVLAEFYHKIIDNTQPVQLNLDSFITGLTYGVGKVLKLQYRQSASGGLSILKPVATIRNRFIVEFTKETSYTP